MKIVKNLPANVGEMGSIPGSKRSPGEGNGNQLLYSCLGNLTDRSLVGYSPQGHKELDTTQQVKRQHEDSKKTRHGQGFTEVGKDEQTKDFYAMKIFCTIL